MKIDLSNRDCMKAVENIGETVYMNICDGTQAVVPWGSADYIAISIMCGFIVLVLSFFCFVGYMIFRGRRYL